MISVACPLCWSDVILSSDVFLFAIEVTSWMSSVEDKVYCELGIHAFFFVTTCLAMEGGKVQESTYELMLIFGSAVFSQTM